MPTNYFQFKKFSIEQDQCAMKVTTDACIFGAWAAKVIAKLKIPDGRMLDIGTGTGLLSLMIAQKNPALQIDAVEIEPGAAKQAAENVSASPYRENIRIIESNAFDPVYSLKYEVMISNPPFYENHLRSPDTKKNIALHSDFFSLKNLTELISKQLKNEGHYFILLPGKRVPEIESLAKAGLSIIQKVRLRQSINHDFFRVIIHGVKKTADHAVMEDELIIYEEKRKYSAAFTSLLQEYYLQL